MEIADYAFLSDCNTATLVSRDATVEWYCPGRFDAPSVFGRMLDRDAGHWRLRPSAHFTSERTYVDDTLVLRTRFTTDGGTVEVTDALVLADGSRGHDIGREVPQVLARRVRGIDGTVAMVMELVPRFDYAMTVPRFTRIDDTVEMRRGPVTLRLTTDQVALDLGDDRVSATFELSAGEQVGFTLAYAQTFPDPVHAEVHAGTAIEDTIEGWTSWVDLHRAYEGRHADLVLRSAVVLQGLTYQPSGAVAAAATTSLPEELDGDDNYDYRFTWLRDLSMTLEAQWVAACPHEASRFFTWLTSATGTLRGGDPQIMYGLGGEQFLTEETLDHLAGFEGSRPVRVGNAAWRQRQLDVMGEILNAAHLLRDQLRPFPEATKQMLVALADHAAERWDEPDAGMWEARDDTRQYVTSKVLCWVALDRAIRLADDLEAGERTDHWREVREVIHATVLEEAWSEEAGAFAGAFGSDQLDASVLLMPIVGFLPADDHRMRATIDRIEGELGEDGSVRRWRDEPGGFLLTAFWLVECLALAGELDRAEAWFSRTVRHANDLGLLSEEVEAGSGHMTGNLPQAFSHVGLVNAAWRLTLASEETDGLDEPEPPS